MKKPVYESWNPEHSQVVVVGRKRVEDILTSLAMPIMPAVGTPFGDLEAAQTRINNTKARILSWHNSDNTNKEIGFDTQDADIVVLALSQRHLRRHDGPLQSRRVGKTIADISRIILRPPLSSLSVELQKGLL